MNKTITLLYASKTGFTGRAAEIIAQIIEESGHTVRLVNAAENPVLEESDLIIIGAPIIMGKIPSEMYRTLKSSRPVIEKSRAALFFTCLRLTEASDGESLPFEVFTSPDFPEESKPLKKMSPLEKSHEIRYYFNGFKKSLPWLIPAEGAVFKGGLDYSKLSFFQRMFMKFMSLIQKDQVEGDFIDEALLREWVVKVISNK